MYNVFIDKTNDKFKLSMIDLIVLFFLISEWTFYVEGKKYIWVIALILFVVSICIRLLNMIKNIEISPYIIWLTIFFQVMMVSYFYANRPDITLEMIKQFFVLLFIVFLFSYYLKDKASVKKAILFIGIAGFVSSAYMILNTDLASIINADVNRLYATRIGFNVSGSHPNIAALYAGISFGCILFYFLKTKKVIFLFMNAVILSAIFLTGSRKMIIFIVSIIMINLIMRQNGIWKKFMAIIISIVICISGYYLLMNVPLFYNSIGNRFSSESGQESTDERNYIGDYAEELFSQKPLLGYGIDNFKTSNPLKIYAHNNYLELLVGVGIIGTMIYYFMYVYMIIRLIIMMTKNDTFAVFLFSLLVSLMIIEYGQVNYYLRPVHIFLITSLKYIYDNDKKMKKFDIKNHTKVKF